jgi:hypothetical protein
VRWPRPLLSVCDVPLERARERECVSRVRGLCGCEKWVVLIGNNSLRERGGEREREREGGRCGREEGWERLGSVWISLIVEERLKMFDAFEIVLQRILYKQHGFSHANHLTLVFSCSLALLDEDCLHIIPCFFFFLTKLI